MPAYSPTTPSTTSSSQASSTSPATHLSVVRAADSTRRSNSSKASSTRSSLREPSPEYISPYPPLPPSRAQSAADRPITAITSTRQGQQRAGTSSSSSQTRGRREDDDQAQKRALIQALNERRVNTVGELRQIERLFAGLGSSDLTRPMTSAWVYYVNSNSLLTELRGLTRNYPFSSEILEEAKRRVHADPASNRSWNYCWLVLAKIHTDRLIAAYARTQAAKPEMWGGRIPLAESVNKLAEAFESEWQQALGQVLRYWESPPIR